MSITEMVSTWIDEYAKETGTEATEVWLPAPVYAELEREFAVVRRYYVSGAIRVKGVLVKPMPCATGETAQ